MKRILAILCFVVAAKASAQSFMTNEPYVWLCTNAANADASWVNDGSAGGVFTAPGTAPILAADYYIFKVGAHMTGDFSSALSETNDIAISMWIHPTNTAVFHSYLLNYSGAAASGWQITMEGSGNLRAGIRDIGNTSYLFKGLGTPSIGWHHVFLRYSWQGPGVMDFLLDGTNMPDLYTLGTPSLGASASAYLGLGIAPDGAVDSAHWCSDVRIWIGAPAIDLEVGSNLYANGRNYYDPPTPPANPDDNYRAAAQWWRMIR